MRRLELKGAAGARARIEDACEGSMAPQELLEEIAAQVDRVVPSDARFYAATDPETSLGMGAGIASGFDDASCDPFWDLEFQVPDYNKFSDIARGPVNVVDLHAATGGRPERSARWREFRSLMGVGAEMRGAFTVGGKCWAIMQLNREGRRGFSSDELEFVGDVGPLVGRAVRTALVSQGTTWTVDRGPGMMILDEDHRVVSATPQAMEWLGEIRSWHVSEAGLGAQLPIEVRFAAHRAREQAAQGERGVASVRTRTRTVGGMWLLLHASCLIDEDGPAGRTAIVIEPAKASDVAPLIVEAYELTPREVDVTRAVARGLSTAEIAAQLFLSRYTVQDYLKRVYEKVGVATRGELVAKMFADHYQEGLDAAIRGSRLSDAQAA